jgi:hypothetical protein
MPLQSYRPPAANASCPAARRGIDQPALSRLENGHTPNPTPDTPRRYAAALGKRLVLTAEEVQETRGRGANGERAVVKEKWRVRSRG